MTHLLHMCTFLIVVFIEPTVFIEYIGLRVNRFFFGKLCAPCFNLLQQPSEVMAAITIIADVLLKVTSAAKLFFCNKAALDV